MKRFGLLAAAIAGAVVAVYDLVSGWPVNGGGWAAAAVLGLFFAGIAVLAAAAVLALAELRRPTRATADEGIASGVRGVVWNWAIASALSVLLFANCSSAVSSTRYEAPLPGPNGLPAGPSVPVATIGPMSDAHAFWSLAPWLLVPVLVALVIPAVLAVVAGRFRDPRWATASFVAAIVAGAVAFLSLPVGFFLGVSGCDVGTVGTCAAGLGSMTNLFAIASAGLFLPYALLLSRGLSSIRRT
jgi:hypothetical protein